MLKLKALRIAAKNATAALKAETDPKKQPALRSKLAEAVLAFRATRLGYLKNALVKAEGADAKKALSKKISSTLARISAGTTKTKYRLEEEETTEEDDEEEEEGNETDREEGMTDERKGEGGEEDDEEEEAAKAALAESDEPPHDDDDDKDKKEKKAARKKAAEEKANAGAIAGIAARLDAIEARQNKADRADRLASLNLTPGERKLLTGKSEDFIQGYLALRPKQMALTPEQALRPLPFGSGAIGKAEGGAPVKDVELTEEQTKMLADVTDPKIREQIIKNWSARVNGAGKVSY